MTGPRSHGRADDDAPLDPTLAEAADLLRAAPAPAPDALARATAATLAAHARARHGRSAGARPAWAAGTRRPLAWAAGVVLAAGVGAGVWSRAGHEGAADAVALGDARGAPAVPAADAVPAVPAAANVAALDEAPRLVRFRLHAPGAGRVTVVGDFNRWDPSATPLAAAGAGAWAADVPLTPGRHAYAFVVDGRRTLDPAAPAERDADFGGTHSVTVVGVAGAP